MTSSIGLHDNAGYDESMPEISRFQGIHRVASFNILAPYTLQITFDDESQHTIDFLPVLEGKLYGPLRELSIFNQVRLDPEVHTLIWPNGADFDPATFTIGRRTCRQ